MAVYTQVGRADVDALLQLRGLGEVRHLQGIQGGIENSNYFVDAVFKGVESKYVLTIFENLSEQDLPYFAALTSYLARSGFAVPNPLPQLDGQYCSSLQGKPAFLVPRLLGAPCAAPRVQDCARLGDYTARMHLALNEFSERRTQPRDLAWMHAQVQSMATFLPETVLADVQHCLAQYERGQQRLLRCARGTVHGDLFRDNVLFLSGEVSGVIDFYHACDDVLLFDLAVIANDWCWQGKAYDRSRLHALLEAYRQVRPWTGAEQQAWPVCLELAALRFWLSRLYSRYVPGYQQRSMHGDTSKDPNEMRAILRYLASHSMSVC